MNINPGHAHPAGRFGFDRDMGATKAMLEVETPGGSGDAVQLTARALTEVKLRFYEPFRRLKIWRQVPPGSHPCVRGGTRLSTGKTLGLAGYFQRHTAMQCSLLGARCRGSRPARGSDAAAACRTCGTARRPSAGTSRCSWAC